MPQPPTLAGSTVEAGNSRVQVLGERLKAARRKKSSLFQSVTMASSIPLRFVDSSAPCDEQTGGACGTSLRYLGAAEWLGGEVIGRFEN